MADLLDLLSGEEPDAMEKAQALQAALRGQNVLGVLGQLSGDKVLAPVGRQVAENALAQEQAVNQIPALRQAMALKKAQLAQEALGQKKAEADFAAQQAPETRSFLANALRKYGYQVDDTTPTPVLEHVLPIAEKGRSAELLEEAKLANRFAVNPVTGQTYNVRTGAPTGPAVATPGGGGSPGLGLKPKEVEEQFKELGQALSTTQGRGNLNRENQQRLNNAERLEALILGPGGQIQNLTPQQVREAGTALAALISQGAMSEHQIEELTPVSMASKFASLKQRILNEPQGAEAQAFLRNMLETAGREKAVVLKQIRQGQAQGLPRFAKLRGAYKERVDNMIRGAGLNPDEFDENLLPLAPAGGEKKRLKFNPATGNLE